ncbi:MAG: O-methyltransferase [Chloroflexi bacterium]|nr:O-methyltransferase [Chloroflexota bacterium]
MDAQIEKVLRDLEEEDARDRTDGTSRKLRLRAVTPEAGRFLHLIVKLTSAQRILEAGTSSGYSTIWLASAARETGATVTTLEIDPAKIERARRSLAAAGLDDVVTIVEGDANETVQSTPGSFDFIFLDIEKELYDGLLNPLVEKLRPGGILIADNLLSHAEDLATFREHAEAHPELECQLIPIPKGELLCRKKTR